MSYTDEENAASPVRTLSREEIAELERTGQITPIEQIPLFRHQPRVSMPEVRYGHARCS